MSTPHRSRARLLLPCVLLAVMLLPLSSTAARASTKPSLRIVTVPGFRIGTAGKGWTYSHPVVLSLHAGPWIVGVELRPARNGAFRVAAKPVDLCGGVRFEAADTAGHTAIARGPALMCPSPVNPPKPILKVMKGTLLSPTTYRLLAPSPGTTVKMRVGDQLYLWEPGTTVPAFTASADGSYLALLEQHTTPARACAQVDCAAGFAWTWVAIRPGETMIDLSPACRQSHPPCGLPDLGLRIRITP